MFSVLAKRFYQFPRVTKSLPTTFVVPKEDHIKYDRLIKSRKFRKSNTVPILSPTDPSYAAYHPSDIQTTQFPPISQETKDCISLIKQQAKSSCVNSMYAIIQLNSRSYSVSENDIIVTKRINNVDIGSVITLTNVREIGSKDHYIRGNKVQFKKHHYSDPIPTVYDSMNSSQKVSTKEIGDNEKEGSSDQDIQVYDKEGLLKNFIPCDSTFQYIDPRFFKVEAVVLEHPRSAKYVTIRRRVGKGPGDKKWRKRSYRDHLSILRVTKIEMNDL